MQKKHQHREAGTFSSADMFTERDLAGTYEESGAVYVTLSDDGITWETDGVVIKGQTVIITAEGTYIFSGTLSEGQIVVDADNAKAQIVFEKVPASLCADVSSAFISISEETTLPVLLFVPVQPATAVMDNAMAKNNASSFFLL